MLNPAGWLRRRTSTEYTAFRYAVLQFLYSTALFFLALSAAIYAVCVSIVGGKVTVGVSVQALLVTTWVLIGLGTLFGLAGGVTALYWLWKGSKDPMSKDVAEIKGLLQGMRYRHRIQGYTSGRTRRRSGVNHHLRHR